MKRSFYAKKLLSMILALALTFGMVPVNFAMAAQDVTKPAADIAAMGTKALDFPGKDSSVLYDFWTGIKSSQDIKLLKDYGTTSNTNWAYFASTPSNALLRGYYGALRFTSTATAGDAWVAYKIKAPAVGRYTATFNYKYHIGCNSADMYIIPGTTAEADISATLAAATPIGNVKFVQLNQGTLQTTKIGQVDFPTAGEYLFVMKVRDRGPSTSGGGQSGMHITSLALNGEAPIPLESIEMTLDNTAVSKTKPAHATVTGKLADGTAANLAPTNLATIKYESSDPSIIAVDETGLITAVSSGEVTIKATVTLDGITKTDEKKVICVLYGGDTTTTEFNLMAGLAANGESLDALKNYDPAKNTNWTYYG
ncbi:MAG: Ig-like domain-containing protein, partial [Clostridia bacterium]